MRTIWQLLFIPALFLYSCSPKGDFSVVAPNSWMVIDSMKNGERFVVMNPLQSDSSLFFGDNIRISNMHSIGASNYMHGVVEELKQRNYWNFRVLETGNTEINRHTVYWEHHYLQTSKDAPNVEQKCYYIGGSFGNIYMIVCTCGEKEMTRFQPFIDTVLRSFRIND
jgi:hypothetical protein